MLLRDISRRDLARLLGRKGVHLDTGAFTTRVRSDVPELAERFAELYGDYAVELSPVIDDFRVRIGRPPGWRRHFAREGQAYIDDAPSFPPFPPRFAFPMFESTMNWCIAKHVLRYLTFHSAAVARDGRAVILAGPSGSGKSTLCATLSHNGWRLLSDELVLLRPEDLAIVPNPRPISLKNEAIELVSAASSEARFGPAYHGTNKGTIAFMQVPPSALARAKNSAMPRLVIAPEFRPNEPVELHEMGKAEGFMWLVENSVNYFSTLRVGFEALSGLVDRCPIYKFLYPSLDEAVATLTRLHDALPTGDEAA